MSPPPVRSRWLEAVIRSPVPKATSVTIAVAATLHSHMDRDGTCWPSEPTIAAEARCSERSARDHVLILERAGLLDVTRRQGAANTYQARLPTPAAVAGVSRDYPGKSGPQPRQIGAQTPAAVASEAVNTANRADAAAPNGASPAPKPTSRSEGRHPKDCHCSACHYGTSATFIRGRPA
jgi:hypothetical protein